MKPAKIKLVIYNGCVQLDPDHSGPPVDLEVRDYYPDVPEGTPRTKIDDEGNTYECFEFELRDKEFDMDDDNITVNQLYSFARDDEAITIAEMLERQNEEFEEIPPHEENQNE